MRDEWLTDLVAKAGHDIDHTFRKSGLLDQLAEFQNRDGGVLGAERRGQQRNHRQGRGNCADPQPSCQGALQDGDVLPQ